MEILEQQLHAYHVIVPVQVMLLLVKQLLVLLVTQLHAQHADVQKKPPPHAVIQPIASQVDVLLTGLLLALAQELAALLPHAVILQAASPMDVDLTTGLLLVLAQEHAALPHAKTQQAASLMDVEVTTGPHLALAQERAAQVVAVAVAADQEESILMSLSLMLHTSQPSRTQPSLHSEHYVPPQDPNAHLIQTYAMVQPSPTQIQLPLSMSQSLMPSLKKSLKQDTA